jgi:hypothetical protein
MPKFTEIARQNRLAALTRRTTARPVRPNLSLFD